MKYFLILLAIITNPLLSVPGSCQSESGESAAIDKLMKHAYKNRLFNGVILISKGDSVVFQRPYGYAVMEWDVLHSIESKFRIASNTKQFTAMLILMLVEQGKLKLHEPVTSYLPRFKNRMTDSVTIHQLLNHTSGVPQSRVITNEHPEFWVTEYEIDEYLDMFENKHLEFEPGTRFSYHSIGYQMLASIIENTTDMSFEAVMNELIFKPLNMENSGIHDVYEQKKKYAFAYEKWYYAYNVSEYYSPTHALGQVGVYTTVGDLLKWNKALNNRTLLSDSLTKMMFTADPVSQRHYEGYGYGWYIGYYEFEDKNLRIDYHQHSGGMPGHTSLITRLPEQDYFIVLLNNTGHTFLELINYEIIRTLFGFSWAMPQDLAVALDQCHSVHLIDSIMADFYSDEDKYLISESDMSGLCYKKIRNGKDELGMAIYKSGLEYFPQSVKLNSAAAEAFYDNGVYDKANELFLEVLKVLPDNEAAKRKIRLIKEKL